MTRPLAALLFLIAGVSACGDDAPVGPPALRLGVDVCDRCAMAISEPRYAAAVLLEDTAGQRTLKFDDIGCLAIWEASASGSTPRRRWVHDRSTGEWADAGTVIFSRSAGLPTPMGSGIAAFTSVSDADAFIADRGGEKLSWEAVLARARDGALAVPPPLTREAAR
jgi:copper chaperone NosL